VRFISQPPVLIFPDSDELNLVVCACADAIRLLVGDVETCCDVFDVVAVHGVTRRERRIARSLS